jgi:malto-oligosyltrehalose trehalohydrolase
VRDFFIHNALYWLTEYHLDGLRLDAVHAIADDSGPDILVELAQAVRAGPGRQRHVHLVLENDRNAARYLERTSEGAPRWYAAQWNDDFHHSAHILATGERDGYYADYARDPVRLLGRCLAEGFAYQGQPSEYRGGERRGEPSADLPATAFVDLLQNHDQVGNRAFGERIGALAPPEALRALTTVLLLAPSPPLLFMGQEWMAPSPFLYFCQFGEDLARSVTEGRRREFARFERFADPEAREAIPDPNDPETFLRSKLDWGAPSREPHASWLQLHRDLLSLRWREIAPRLANMTGGEASYEVLGRHGLRVYWRLGDGALLVLRANLGDEPIELPPDAGPPGESLLHLEPASAETEMAEGRLVPWSVRWSLLPPKGTAA